MSLLSVDITKAKRLSLEAIRLPTVGTWANEPIQPESLSESSNLKLSPIEKPPTEEEIAYSSLLAINPLLAELVTRLDLVSSKTGERVKKVELKEEYKLERKPQEVDHSKLKALAQRIIEGEICYSKADIIARIKEATNVSQERAENGFMLMLQAGAIEPTLDDSYYLTGSTPFLINTVNKEI